MYFSSNFLQFSTKSILGAQKNRLGETVLWSTLNALLTLKRDEKISRKGRQYLVPSVQKVNECI